MQNSIVAGAVRIVVKVIADEAKNLIMIRVEDNGRGMKPDFVAKVADPFVTTRTTRNVGLGIPLLAAAAQASEGMFRITSKSRRGTCVEVSFGLHHIDRSPLGDITSTMVNTIVSNPDISFRYEQLVNGKEFVMDTDEMKEQLGDTPIDDPMVIRWMREYMEQGAMRDE